MTIEKLEEALCKLKKKISRPGWNETGKYGNELLTIRFCILLMNTGGQVLFRNVTKLIYLFKKGDKDNPENDRCIGLLPVMYKMYSKIIDKRFKLFLKFYW